MTVFSSAAKATDLPTQLDRAAAPRREEDAAPSAASRPASERKVGEPFVLLLPLLAALLAWSLAGKLLVPEPAHEALEVAGILVMGIMGVRLASRAQSRSSRMERAYSSHLEELSQRLRSLAYRDSLTDLHNHRFFHEQLSHEVEASVRYNRPVSVILMDLDKFKEVNDTYGHLMGDRLLALVGQVISNQVRGADIAARYGGDEFAIILPDTPREAAEQTAKKLAKAIATGNMYASSVGQALPLSTSYGVASCPDEARTVTELLQLADDRLYAAKDGSLLPDSKVFVARE